MVLSQGPSVPGPGHNAVSPTLCNWQLEWPAVVPQQAAACRTARIPACQHCMLWACTALSAEAQIPAVESMGQQCYKPHCIKMLFLCRNQPTRCLLFAVNPPGNYYSAVNVTGPVNYTCTATEPCAITCPADTFSPGLAKQKACTPCPTGFKTNGGTGKTTSQSCSK